MHGARETATIKDPRLKIGLASEMIVRTETKIGIGIVLAIEGGAETETGTGAAVLGHVVIMVIPIGIVIVGKIEIRNVSVHLFNKIYERYRIFIPITDIFMIIQPSHGKDRNCNYNLVRNPSSPS